MSKTILITGSTDGIGLATVNMLLETDNTIIVHGRTKMKVESTLNNLSKLPHNAKLEGCFADLTDFVQINEMLDYIKQNYSKIDVLINNAGVYNIADAKTRDNLETRFVVNTIAPYYITKELLPLMNGESRVVNLSSAAQSSVNLSLIKSYSYMNPGDAYAQSKLALTMWSHKLGTEYLEDANKPSIIAVNPKSFLGSKMVKEAYGVAGHDIRIGADVLYRAALSVEFENASGKYFDNDYGRFSDPHPDALDEKLNDDIIETLDAVIQELTSK